MIERSSADKAIPLSVPYLGGREAQYLAQCVQDNWVSSVGPFVNSFEEQFRDVTGARHAVACASGTAALHLSLVGSGVRPGDLVAVSDLTFIASANAIRYAGAQPLLVDCRSSDWQMDADLLREFLHVECDRREDGSYHRGTGKRVAGIIPVHILGLSADIRAICELGSEFSVPVIEDAAEALGVKVGGRQLGTFGLTGCFSFNGNKLITSGGGGMVVTNDEALAAKVLSLSQQAKNPGVEFEHHELGFNYRMSNLHAAVGLAQLERLDDHIAQKVHLARQYREQLGDLPGVSFPTVCAQSVPTWWLFSMQLGEEARVGSRELIARLGEVGIESRPLWQPMHLSRVHGSCPRLGGRVSESLYRSVLSLPCSVGLSDEDQGRVIERVVAALR